MKKIVFAAAVLGFTAMTTTVLAQDDKGEKGDKGKKESQEIIIRKKGDKDTKITVEIKGDKVTINGKPLSEFKDDEITVNKRNITIRNVNGNRITMTPGDFDGFGYWNGDDNSGAFLGVTTEPVEGGGAKITEITKESAAEKAGLKVGDIITKVGDKKIDDSGTLYDVISDQKPKDKVKVYYTRDGKENSADAVLGERKGSSAMAYSFSGPDGLTRSYSLPRKPNVKSVPRIEAWNDNEMSEMYPRTYTPGTGNFNLYNDMLFSRHKLGLKIQDTEDGNGAKVLDVDKDSPAEKAGLKKDDIVTEIGGKKVTNTDEVREQLHNNQEKSSYNIKAKRNGSEMSFDIKIPKKLKTANL